MDYQEQPAPFWPRAVILSIIGLVFVGLIYLVLTAPVYAQEQPQAKCGPAGEVRAHFLEKFKEQEISGGLIDDNTMFSLLVSPGGETWTLIATGRNGVSCIVAAGKNWFQEALPPAGDPA